MECPCQGNSSRNESCDRSRASKRYLYRNQQHCQLNFACLENIYNDKLLCDVILVAEGSEIHAHKLMLATSSLFFYWKFRNDGNVGLLNRINIENIAYETLSTVINYLYKSEVLLTDANVGDLLGAAHMFGMPDLQKVCKDFLKANIDSKTCVAFENIAMRYKYEELLPITNAHIVDHLPEVMKQDDYLYWTHDQILNIVSSNELCSAEQDVLECVIRWVGHDLKNRKDKVYSLMSHVRFSSMSQKDNLQRLEQEPWLMNDIQFLQQFMKSHVLQRSPRTGTFLSKFLLVLGRTQNNILSMEMYDFEKNIWTEGPELFKIKCIDVAINGTKIYCITSEPKIKSIDFSCNTQQMNWSECKMSRLFDNIAVINDRIYAVRACTEDSDKLKAAEYDVLSGEWKRISDISDPRNYIALAALNENLYTVGGMTTENDYSNLVECYKPDTDTWYTTSAMSICRSRPGVGVLGGSLFIVGGYNSDGYCRQVESFDPVKSSWRRLPDMNVARYAPGVIAVNGQLYVIGGYNEEDGHLNSVEIYDARSNVWSMLPSKMNTGKFLVAAGLINKSKLQF